MRCLLANRWFRWMMFLAALVGLGVAIYRIQPHEPRWTSATPLGNEALLKKFSPDGERFYTAPPAQVRVLNNFPIPSKPTPAFQVWNAATGQVIASYPLEGEVIGHHVISRDRFFFAGECWREGEGETLKQFFWLVDLRTGEGREIGLPYTADGVQLALSPCGKILAVVSLKSEKELTPRNLRIYETATGKLIDERPSIGLLDDTSFTDEYLVHRASRDDRGVRLEFWSLKEQKTVAFLDHTNWRDQISPDGRFMVAQKNSPGEQNAATWLIWNFRTRKLQAQFHSAPADSVTICPNGESVVLRGEKKIELRELATGKLLGTLPAAKFGWQTRFSPDSRFLTLSDMATGRDPWRVIRLNLHGLRVIEVATFKEVWTDESTECNTLFTNDSRRVIHAPEPAAGVSILDSATGSRQGYFEWTIKVQSVRGGLSLTPDGRTLLATDASSNPFARPESFWKRALCWLSIDPNRFDNKYYEETIVYDMESNRERLRLFGYNIADALLSDDGSTLITTHDEEAGRVMRCWDVGGLKPLRWAIGVPAAVGVLLYGMAKVFRRWRKPRKVAVAMPPA